MSALPEADQIVAWEMEQFMRLGFPVETAGELAEQGVDWHHASDLLTSGCPPDLCVEILRELG